MRRPAFTVVQQIPITLRESLDRWLGRSLYDRSTGQLTAVIRPRDTVPFISLEPVNVRLGLGCCRRHCPSCDHMDMCNSARFHARLARTLDGVLLVTVSNSHCGVVSTSTSVDGCCQLANFLRATSCALSQSYSAKGSIRLPPNEAVESQQREPSNFSKRSR